MTKEAIQFYGNKFFPHLTPAYSFLAAKAVIDHSKQEWVAHKYIATDGKPCEMFIDPNILER